ncbi:MAG: hypothetical protein ACYTHJ_14615 [Planctomycetota bacterium]|jgi:hypothetical protein
MFSNSKWIPASLVLMLMFSGPACVPVPDINDVIDIIDDAGSDIKEPNDASLTTYATNTDGAAGLAFRASDGAMFITSANGLFGPIEEGDDVSDLTPLGATNLGDPDIFDAPPSSTILAITEDGEFWIGSNCCSTMGVVAPAGGNAEQFVGLIEGFGSSNIKPEALAVVPDGFSGDQFQPGQILVSEDTTFSKLSAIDTTDRSVIQKIDNPVEDSLNREGQHLTFGADGNLYSGKALGTATIAGIQMIDTDGTPIPVDGTFRVSVNTFVVLENGDILINGSFRRSGDLPTDSFNGLFFYDAGSETLSEALTLAQGDNSDDDEMVIGPDGTIYMTQPALNRVVIVNDRR